MTPRFYLGVHEPHWLGRTEFAGVPLFVAHQRLQRIPRLPQIRTRWALDSGGFTQLSKNPDGWPQGCEEPYLDAVQSYVDRGPGLLDWASQQDWMNEPWLMHGRTVLEHQERTVANFLRLRELRPDLQTADGFPLIRPVVQGWKIDDYHRCVDLFASAGVDLAAFPAVGIGSVCRRQGTQEIVDVVTAVAGRGIRLHGFGVKMRGLAELAPVLSSADSMAWSYNARKNPPLPECSHGKNGTSRCANCPRWALAWRRRLLLNLIA